ncbi:MAG TPA: hypothetical protein VM582_00250, partial [Candidatus Thermoplasmatota archaeon]|nr:hypothetical protein [Candidatus Thermoplasmatota archaeon]
MLRASAAALALLVLLVPSATAFSSPQQELTLAYAATGTPTMISAGALFLDGTVAEGLLVAGSNGTSFDRIPELRALDRRNGAAVNVTHAGATLELVSGALLWTFPDGASAQVATSERYAIAVALPQAPLPSNSLRQPTGFLLASEEVNGTVAFPRGESTLVPLDAVVTIRDARGQVLPEWNARRVNQGASAGDDPESLQV